MTSMFDFVVGKDLPYKDKVGGGTIADFNEIQLLSPGAVAIFTEDNRIVETTSIPAFFVGVKSFFFAIGRATDVLVTQFIDRDAFHRAKCAYVAPVKQLVTVTPLNFPTAFIADEEGEVIVWQQQDGIEPAAQKDRHSTGSKVSDTNTTYLQRMVDKINVQSRLVDAADVVAGVSFTLTAKRKNEVFQVGFGGPVFEEAVQTLTTPTTYSKGDADDLLSLEAEGKIYEGDTSPFWFPRQLFSKPDVVVAGETYVCYQLNWQAESRGPVNSQNSAIIGVSAFFPDGAAVVGNIDTILGLLVTAMPSTGSGSAPVATL